MKSGANGEEGQKEEMERREQSRKKTQEANSQSGDSQIVLPTSLAGTDSEELS